MKKTLFILFLASLPLLLIGQRRKNPAKQLNMAPGEKYILYSDVNRELQFARLDTISGMGSSDDDWAFVSGSTISDPVYRAGLTNIFTQANTHGLRVDSTFQFRMNGGGAVFDWQNGNEDLGFEGLFFRSQGDTKIGGFLNAGKNHITIGNTNDALAQSRLGAYVFAGKKPSTGKYHASAFIDGIVDETWVDTSFSSKMGFYTTNLGDTIPTQNFTIHEDGRIQLNRYGSLDDGIPTHLIGNRNDNHYVTVHPISGTPDIGRVIGVGASGLEYLPQSGSTKVRYQSGNALFEASATGVTYTLSGNTATITIPSGVFVDYIRINEEYSSIGNSETFFIEVIDNSGDVNQDLASFRPYAVHVIERDIFGVLPTGTGSGFNYEAGSRALSSRASIDVYNIVPAENKIVYRLQSLGNGSKWTIILN